MSSDLASVPANESELSPSKAILLALGAASTAIYAASKGWAIVIPALAWGGGIGAALLIGALAGLLPALRAAGMSPTEALWSIAG